MVEAVWARGIHRVRGRMMHTQQLLCDREHGMEEAGKAGAIFGFSFNPYQQSHYRLLQPRPK